MPQMKFIARVTSMGKDKVIIYVPKDFHKDILKNFRGRQVKVTPGGSRVSKKRFLLYVLQAKRRQHYIEIAPSEVDQS